MSTAVMTDRIAEASPRFKARMAGVFYLLTILFGGFGEFISRRFVVYGDAAATAKNILSHESLFRIGFASYLIETACSIVVTALFYHLLKPVSRSLALLAAFFSLVGWTIKTLSRLFFVAPLLVLGGTQYLSVFKAEQLQALALLFLKVNDQGAGVALVFLGFHALLDGYLMVRSTFLPRILGALGIVGGFGWLSFLYRPLAIQLFPYILAIGLLGAGALILWLLVMGVNEQRWKEQASAAAASIS